MDTVGVARLRRSLSRTAAFAKEIFTSGERRDCDARPDPARHYAARFAAKEAFLKAVGTGLFAGISLQDIEVVQDGSGPPRLQLGSSARAALARVGATTVHLSFSHVRDHAFAMVVLS